MRTKKDREMIARSLTDVALMNGATCDVAPALVNPKKGLDVTIRKGDYNLHIWLDGERPDDFLGHWVADNGARFPKGFRGVNQQHFAKATICETLPGVFVTRVAQDLFDIDRYGLV